MAALCTTTVLIVALCLVHLSYAGKPSCVQPFDSTHNYFPNAYVNDSFALPVGQTDIKDAYDFTVTYKNYYKVVRNEFDNTSYVLYEECTKNPGLTTPANARVFEIPLSNVATDTSVAVTFLEFLGVMRSVSQVAMAYVSSPCAQKLLASGNITSFVDAPKNFMGPIISGMLSTNIPGASKQYITFSTSTDPGTLKRAEWIKYLALFFDQESQASSVYNSISENYQCLAQSTAANTSSNKPVVAWLSFYGNIWTVYGTEYKMQYVSDAGGVNVDVTSVNSYNMSVASNVSDFQAILQTLDVVIDETYAVELDSYSIDNFTSNAQLPSGYSAPFLDNQQLWRFDYRTNGPPNYGLDWYESAIAQPNVVLNDIITILQHSSSNTSAGSSPYYFRNVAKGQKTMVLTAADCTAADPAAAREPVIIACTIPSSNSSTSSPVSSSSSVSAPAPSPSAAASSSSSVSLLLLALLVSVLSVAASAPFITP
eukprot:TRINITY_DN10718_c0_g1_i2.p1 TRINITY_DN10718_c0_g1~~TRINITY_DN10718_c0_g1_i2.p1  ORF type:complete len:483 (-),score=114.90 TRINITY_DN10718_c0_g1_i2:164-1612(-)